MNLIHDFGRYSAIAVKLLPAAVATAVLILAPPELFGRYSNMLPFAKSNSPSPKLRTLFAPSRANVRSVKVSSARESLPVRTAVPGRTLSFIEAGRGAAVRCEQLHIVNCLSDTSFVLSLPAIAKSAGSNRNGEERRESR